jgi:hypothetical protein
MAKPTIRTKGKKSSAKGSQVSFRAIKRQAKARSAAEKALTERVSAKAPKTLVGREARTEERFRELVAWYMLQGADEATARRRARDEIDDDPRKD